MRGRERNGDRRGETEGRRRAEGGREKGGNRGVRREKNDWIERGAMGKGGVETAEIKGPPEWTEFSQFFPKKNESFFST